MCMTYAIKRQVSILYRLGLKASLQMMAEQYSDMSGFYNNPAYRSERRGSRKPCPCCSCNSVRNNKEKVNEEPSKKKPNVVPSIFGPLNMIESEYIKNLQLQIYYLEMELKYLRNKAQQQDNARKADDQNNKPREQFDARTVGGYYSRPNSAKEKPSVAWDKRDIADRSGLPRRLVRQNAFDKD